MKTDAQLYLELRYNGSDLSLIKALMRSLLKKTIIMEESHLFCEISFLFADGSIIILNEHGFVAS